MPAERFHETAASRLLSVFETMRGNRSMLMLWYMLRYFRPRKLLEIGFYQGQTFGLMIEAAEPNSELLALDKKFDFSVYDRYYRDQPCCTDKKIEFLQINSHDFKPPNRYDFINVDGGIPRLKDMVMASQNLEPNGIMMIDNYTWPEIEPDVDAFLAMDHGMVPFLSDTQALYLHRASHDASAFLDEFLEETLSEMFYLENQCYKNHVVKMIEPRPVHIIDITEAFEIYCRHRNF